MELQLIGVKHVTHFPKCLQPNGFLIPCDTNRPIRQVFVLRRMCRVSDLKYNYKTNTLQTHTLTKQATEHEPTHSFRLD